MTLSPPPPPPTSTPCLVPSGSSFGTAVQAHLYPGQETMFIHSISHNLFSIDSQWICFSTADDLARKQTPLKQEPSKALLGSVRHPRVWLMPPPLPIAKGPSSRGQVTSTPAPPNLPINFFFQGLGATQTRDKISFRILKPTVSDSLKPEEIIKSPGLRQPPHVARLPVFVQVYLP